MSAGEIVLETSAVIAMILGEAGGAMVTPHLDNARISTVSLVETLEVLNRKGRLSAAARASATALAASPFDQHQAQLAADILIQHRRRGISIGDACCVALGISLSATVLTADQIWETLDLPVSVSRIR